MPLVSPFHEAVPRGTAATMTDPTVTEVVETYLATMDAKRPGLVQGYHLVGSAALDDFAPGVSDINFVAVTASPLRAEDLVAVAEVHRDFASKYTNVPLDGPYLSRTEIEEKWSAMADGPHVRRGVFFETGSHGRGYLDRHAWSNSAETLLGLPIGTDLSIQTQTVDEAAIRLAERTISELLANERDDASHSVTDENLVSQTVLTLARLHYTLTTGRLTSKTKAGLYGLVTFSSHWSPLLEAALLLRRAPNSTLPGSPPATVVAYARMVASDMRELAPICSSEEPMGAG